MIDGIVGADVVVVILAKVKAEETLPYFERADNAIQASAASQAVKAESRRMLDAMVDVVAKANAFYLKLIA